MRLHRFFVSQPLGEDVVINELDKIKQWTKVFRYKKGDLVILFNGKGEDKTYSIENISLKNCLLRQKNGEKSVGSKRKITLFLSIIKKDNFELAIQKVTELGCSKVVPILSERGEKKGLNTERLQKISTEASEQSGRGDILKISSILKLKDALDLVSSKETSFYAQVGGNLLKGERLLKKVKASSHINIFIGPEGGWSKNEEKEFKNKKIESLSLGKNVLRAETAAIVSTFFFLL